ncbi:acyl-CoA dehydrogenase family protein [Protofrankia symbiont of Coriaria ruscifolia]|uniref:acyl-CoA dehydrogenase family protein n=1 Tax=Protofrankia symbiont of Coriaria ruscifolia TaxID=1306542 RepID=UPI001040FAFF|nr:acyl-CoA dehydrogenase family protein [Protofrankia symbiont of Coriaria ruscifolia]
MNAVPTADTSPQQIAERTRAFIQEHVFPVEREIVIDGRPMDDALRVELQKAAREAGVFGPLSPVAYGGLGLDTRALAYVLEAAGASLIGPIAVNASAPDDGNIHLLVHLANAEQAQRYLAPLARGEVRSSLAVAEPSPGAGSDLAMLRTTAEKVAGGWKINGVKHFTTGADGAAFSICMAATTGGATIFLVDQDNPGLTVGRRMPTLDHSAPGGHCEVAFNDCFVPDDAVLGEVGKGFEHVQLRLAPSRMMFSMSWLGVAVRAHAMSAARIVNRKAFGIPVADHGMAQAHVADNEIDIAAARALIHSTAAVIDEHGALSGAARHASSITKTFVSEAVWRVLDRAVQLYGGLGVCEDELVARFLVEARGFRIYEGPSEVLRWSIARRVLRAYR